MDRKKLVWIGRFENQKLQQTEMARLKRENASLEERVAFLKKAAGDNSDNELHLMVCVCENMFQ